MAFEVFYSPEAIDHLLALTKFEQVMVLDQVENQLIHQPNLPTRRRKLPRPNPIAPWELQLGELRVFYEVLEPPISSVSVKAVGKKVGNQLSIGGERIDL